MSKIICTLDACTVINLILIDEEDYLLKKLSLVDLHLAEKVFYEINRNISKEITTSEYESKDIDQVLTYFRQKRVLDDVITTEFGKNYFAKIKNITNYSKLNGEFYSVALSMYLSRFKSQKVFFYTDDIPAKVEFKEFYNVQQIGHIADSVDFLMMIYWLDDNFRVKELDRFLDNLHSRYATERKLFLSELRAFYESKLNERNNRNQLKRIRELSVIINHLNNADYLKFKQSFSGMTSLYPEISRLLKKYKLVFESSSMSYNITEKIIAYREKIKVDKIYKLMDLCD